jgi:hypothetical protein
MPANKQYLLYIVSNDQQKPLDVKCNRWREPVVLSTIAALRARMWTSVRNAHGSVMYFNERNEPQLTDTKFPIHMITFSQRDLQTRTPSPSPLVHHERSASSIFSSDYVLLASISVAAAFVLLLLIVRGGSSFIIE